MAGLNNADADGRILLDSAAGTLKFLLLNAAAHFSKVSFPWSVGALPGLPYIQQTWCKSEISEGIIRSDHV